jgi:signal transduction histidine kinase
MNKVVFLVCLIIVSLSVYGQSSVFKNDSLKITELGSRSLEIVYNNSDSARKLINHALALCEQMNHDGLSGLTYNYLGIYHDVVGDNDSAFLAYKLAAEYAIKRGSDVTLAASYNNIGLLHWNLNQLTEASSYFFKAAEIYEGMGNEKGLANAYSNIALIFEDQRRADDALDYGRRALAIRLKLQDTLNIGRSYANIGIFLSQKGLSDSGVYYSIKALPYFRYKNNKYGLGMCYQNMGTDFHILRQTDSAFYYAVKALDLWLELGNKKYIAASYGLLGSIYKTRQEYHLSDQSFRSAAAIYKKYGVHGELWKIYDHLSYVNEQMGQSDSAFQFLKARVQIIDTLHSTEKIAKLYEIEEQYESEKTKRELAESNGELATKKQQSQLLVFVIILIALIALMILWFYTTRIRKNRATKQQELLLQKLEISRELHDNIGSQLTYLNVKLEQIKDPKVTEGLTDIKQFAKSTITDLRSAIWGLSKDISVADLEMKIASEVQKAQSNELKVELSFESGFSGALNSITAVNALRIVQEALQNAVKHSGATSVKINAIINQENLDITISDNGKGFMDKGSGFGLRFMEQRSEKMGAKLSITSTDLGTVVSLIK